MSLLIPTRALSPTSSAYPKGYHKGNVGGLPAIEPDLIADNIRWGTTVFNILGTMVRWLFDIKPPTLVVPLPVITLTVAEDHSGGGHVGVPPALAVPVPTVDKAAAATSVNAVGGAVAHDDDGVDSDETAEANEDTADDMTLLQPDGAIADWYALGDANKFDGNVLNVSTVGADITLDTFEYSKGGGAWGTLTVIMNQLNNYETLGKRWFTFVRPGDWAIDTFAGIANMYWIKFKASAVAGGYIQPFGARAWILVYP